MALINFGDLAQTAQLRKQMPQTRAALSDLGQEVVTGRATKVGEALGGDYGQFAAIERGLSATKSYMTAANEVGGMLSRIQATLDRAREDAADLGAEMLRVSDSNQRDQIQIVAEQAIEGFDPLVSSFNQRLGGQALFAGNATDQAALADAPDLREMIADAVDGATTANEFAAALDEWFAPGGGFGTDGYAGSDEPISPLRIGPDESVSLDVTAQDPAIRELLKGFAMGVVLADGALADDPAEAAKLAERAGVTLSGAHYGLVEAQAGLGVHEERIERAITRHQAEGTALAETKNELVGVDQADAATRFEAKRVQLEMMHMLTARLAGLSLAERL